LIAALLIVVGAVWVIQGFAIVPTGSFMDGDALWGFLGLGCLAVGIATLGYDRWRRVRQRP